VLILAALSAGVDVATGSGLRTVFTVTFVIAAALSAATVHNEDLFASVVLVPLAYAAVAGIAGLADGSGAGTLNTIGSIASTMINAAPSLMMATVATAVIAGARAYANRRASRSGRSDRAGLTGRAHA
jgi:hypothetical protein